MLTRFHTIATLAGIPLVLASLAALPCRAQEFSADVVQKPADGTTTTRLYVGTDAMRIQTLDGGQPSVAMIFDVEHNAMTMVNDKDHTYIGGANSALGGAAMQAMNRTGGGGLLRIFHPTTSGEPCTEWNTIVQSYAHLDSMSTPPHFSCQDMGSDTVNGRPAHKWAVTSTRGSETEHGEVWIDQKLHVVSRSRAMNGKDEMELENISEGPQSDALFAVPAGYREINLSSVMAHLRDGKSADSSIAAMLGAAAKDVGKDAEQSTKDAAKQKTKDNVKSKLHKLIHVP